MSDTKKPTQRMTIVGVTFGRWMLTLMGVLTASGVAASISVVTNYGQRITRVETQIEDVKSGLEKMDKRLDKIDLRQDRLEQKMDEMLRRLPK